MISSDIDINMIERVRVVGGEITWRPPRDELYSQQPVEPCPEEWIKLECSIVNMAICWHILWPSRSHWTKMWICSEADIRNYCEAIK